jgi:hypothetical protein
MMEECWIALHDWTLFPPEGVGDLMIFSVAERKDVCALIKSMDGWMEDVMLYELIRSSRPSRFSFGRLGLGGTVVEVANFGWCVGFGGRDRVLVIQSSICSSRAVEVACSGVASEGEGCVGLRDVGAWGWLGSVAVGADVGVCRIADTDVDAGRANTESIAVAGVLLRGVMVGYMLEVGGRIWVSMVCSLAAMSEEYLLGRVVVGIDRASEGWSRRIVLFTIKVGLKCTV